MAAGNGTVCGISIRTELVRRKTASALKEKEERPIIVSEFGCDLPQAHFGIHQEIFRERQILVGDKIGGSFATFLFYGPFKRAPILP